MLNKYEGRKFLVLGNGPSIDCYENEFYHNFDGITIGINYIRQRFVPDYFVSVDFMGNSVMQNFGETAELYSYKTKCMRPMGDGTWKTGEPHLRNEYVIPCKTSAARAMTIAYAMGASELHLVGIDLCCSPKGKPYMKERRASYMPPIDVSTLGYTEKRLDGLPLMFRGLIELMKKGGCKSFDKSPFGKLGIEKDLTGISNSDI